jgi:regulator of PEP synthase PpsR (kinase-PPPase family)
MKERPLPKVPTIHVVSDSMGITAQSIARAAAAHFGETDPNVVVLANVRTFEEIRAFLEREQQIHRKLYDDDRIIVFYTLVISELKEALDAYVIAHPTIHAVDVLSGAIEAMEQVSGLHHHPIPGEQHTVNESYFRRIEALEFTIEHDDGLSPQDLPDAEIVIVGVSRTSKTPTSIYLGQQGYKVANVPIVAGIEPPKELFKVDSSRIFGLITTPEVLVGIRRTRMGESLGENSNYASLGAVFDELEQAKAIMRRLGCVIIDTEDRAIEETAQEILCRYKAAHPRIAVDI